MTVQPAPAPRRHHIPIFLVLAIICFIFAVAVAAGQHLVTNSQVWLGAGLIAVCLHLWFATEL